MSKVELSLEGWEEFISAFETAGKGDFHKKYMQWLEELGINLLDLVVEEITSLGVVDTGRLLKSFTQRDVDSIWEVREKNLVLEIGSNVPYAKFVNDGHFANPQGVSTRWIPGRWIGDSFRYDRGSSTGMLLRQQWIEGYHYWEKALAIFQIMFGRKLEEKLQQWLDEYF